MKTADRKCKHYKYCGGYYKDDDGEIVICKGECNPPQKQEVDEYEKAIEKAWEDIKSGKDNCKACGAVPGTEHKDSCKWLKEHREQESGKWEKKLDKILYKYTLHTGVRNFDDIKDLFVTELQEAERRGYRRIRKWTNGRNVTKDSLRAELTRNIKPPKK